MRTFLSTFLGVCWAIIFFCFSLLFGILAFSRTLPLHWIANIWSPVLHFLIGLKVRIKGQENFPPKEKNAIYFFNHQSFLDIPIAQYLVKKPLYFILKKELKHFPFVGWWASYVGMVFIDRSNSANSKESLKQVADQIRNGKDIAIFPEGTRSTDGKIGKIKLGGIFLASESSVPIIPIVISGTEKAMPKGSFTFKPAEVKVKIGEPLQIPANLSDENLELWRHKIRALMQTMKDEVDLESF